MFDVPKFCNLWIKSREMSIYILINKYIKVNIHIYSFIYLVSKCGARSAETSLIITI